MSNADTQQKFLIASGIAAVAVFLTLIVVAKSQQEDAPEFAHEQISATAGGDSSKPSNVAKAERSKRTLDYDSTFRNTATPTTSLLPEDPAVVANVPPRVDVLYQMRYCNPDGGVALSEAAFQLRETEFTVTSAVVMRVP